jgi:hypothetical protein
MESEIKGTWKDLEKMASDKTAMKNVIVDLGGTSRGPKSEEEDLEKSALDRRAWKDVVVYLILQGGQKVKKNKFV